LIDIGTDIAGVNEADDGQFLSEAMNCKDLVCEGWHSPADFAAHTGNVDVLQFLLDNGAQLRNQTLQHAIRNKQLEGVRWLLAHGCLPGTEDLQCALDFGPLDTAKLLVEHGAEGDSEDIKDYWEESDDQGMSVTGSMDKLLFLMELGAEWTVEDYTYMLRKCTAEQCLESAKWVRGRGAEWPERVFCSEKQRDAAPNSASLKPVLLQLAISHGPPGAASRLRGPVWPANIRAWALSAGCDTIVLEATSSSSDSSNSATADNDNKASSAPVAAETSGKLAADSTLSSELT
jgi:hypothetical protein